MTAPRTPLPEAPLSSRDLTRLCEYLYRETGMMFGESKRYYIQRRTTDRMDATGIRPFPAYLAYLRATPTEREILINAFTVNETYFYREEHQFRCLSRSILPEIAKTRGPGDKIRIWSAPCSSGEETYSIAVWLLENWPMVDAFNVEIVGSDIDTRMLSEAAEGDYGERALARLPAPVKEAYFEAPHDGRRRIIADLRESVLFQPVNLIDAASVAPFGKFDVIFCRNLLIYFDDASRQAASANIYDALHPGGFICLGHSESMSRIDPRFKTRRFPDAIVYQRERPHG
jgi:chemotaxis protein methyltransferase CheR